MVFARWGKHPVTALCLSCRAARPSRQRCPPRLERKNVWNESPAILPLKAPHFHYLEPALPTNEQHSNIKTLYRKNAAISQNYSPVGRVSQGLWCKRKQTSRLNALESTRPKTSSSRRRPPGIPGTHPSSKSNSATKHHPNRSHRHSCSTHDMQRSGI